MHSMQQSFQGTLQDSSRASPGRTLSTPSKNQSVSSVKRTQSNNASHSKGEFPWDSPTRVADYLQEVVRTNLDKFAADLPKIISAIFGIPMTAEDVYAAQTEEKRMKPLLFRVSEDFTGAGGHKLVQLVRARSQRTEASQVSLQGAEREEHGLLGAVRKVRRYHHNAKDFTFPCRYLPSSLFPRSMMGSDQIVTDRATGQSMLRCNAYELLLYAVAAFPIVCRERDLYVPQHSNGDEEFVSSFGHGYSGPTDAYLIILESYLDDVLNSQARKQATEDAFLMVQVFSAYWLMPNIFDLSRPRADSFAGGITCLEHTLAGLPTRRHLKAAVALVRKVTHDDAVQAHVGTASPPVSQQRSYRPAQPRAARTLSWAVQQLQRPLYVFLRRALVHTQTQWTASKNVEAALEAGGELARYVELWRTVTTPRLRVDGWSTYVQGSFLFFTVVLLDLLRLLRVIFRDLNKSIALPARHRSQYKFLSRLLDEFFDVLPLVSSSYSFGKQPQRRAPKERWQQACRIRNQVLPYIFARHGQPPPPLDSDGYGVDLALKHWQECVGPESEGLQDVFGRYMEQGMLEEFPVDDGDRKLRVVAEVPGQHLLEAKMLDDFVLVEAGGHQRRMVWRPQHEADREGRASPGRGAERRRIVWQQLYREVDALQELLLRGAQAVVAVKQTRGLWQCMWEEARDRLSVKYENGQLRKQDPVSQLLYLTQRLDLFWADFPPAGLPGGERAGQLWDLYPEHMGSTRTRGEVARLRWEAREAQRAEQLQPPTQSMHRSDVESLCQQVWSALDAQTFSELFGDGKGGPGPAMDKARFLQLFGGGDMFAGRRLKEVRPQDVEELWRAMDVAQRGAVTYADIAALLSPDEAERRLYWRDKLLRGERRCCVGGPGEAHVPALAGHGSPLPLLSPHRRKARAEPSAVTSPAGGLRGKGLPQSGVKRGLLVLQVWLSSVLNRRLRLPWSVQMRAPWAASISHDDHDAWEEPDDGGVTSVVALVLWACLLVGVGVVPLCTLPLLVGLATEVCSVPLRLSWMAACMLILIATLPLAPPMRVRDLLGAVVPTGAAMRVLSHVAYGGRPRFNIGRVDLTRYSPWWLVIVPGLLVYAMLYA